MTENAGKPANGEVESEVLRLIRESGTRGVEMQQLADEIGKAYSHIKNICHRARLRGDVFSLNAHRRARYFWAGTDEAEAQKSMLTARWVPRRRQGSGDWKMLADDGRPPAMPAPVTVGESGLGSRRDAEVDYSKAKYTSTPHKPDPRFAVEGPVEGCGFVSEWRRLRGEAADETTGEQR